MEEKERIYTIEEIKDKTLKYFKGDELACNVWIDKYCLKNLNGEFVEDSPLIMYQRLATEFERIENKYPNPITYEEIYNLLNEQKILPGGSLLFGIGNNYSISSLGNCFVIGNDSDSYGGICLTDQEQAQLMKRRAGVGHDISHLRPANSKVTNAAGTSTGAVSFMHRFSNTTREVAQNGRRGALMLTMNINHPDIVDFITAKDDLTKITGANISVKITNEFMQRVSPYSSIRMYDHIWNKLIHQAWKSAEPGVLFWDTIVNESPADCYEGFKSTSTNPCGEIPLCPYDSCRLLAINLTKYVKYPFTDKAEFDLEQFKHDVYIAQKIMDDVVDLEHEKIDKILDKILSDPEDITTKQVELDLWIKIRDKLLQGRRTGLSGIGLADCLASLNILYSSNSGITLAEEIYKQLAITAYQSSIDMAKDRGAFPIWHYTTEKENPFINRIYQELGLRYSTWYKGYGRRNIALLTIPPSGTISLLAKISSGIEPVYQLDYKRRRKVNSNHLNISFTDKNGDCWEEYVVYHPKLNDYLEINGITDTSGIKTPWDGSTAYELNPLDRVKMQAAIQKWVDHSISSTINLPKEATEEQVSEIYMEAWKLGCKGITIYREGSRDGVLISNTLSQKETKFVTNNAPKRLKDMPCDIYTPVIHLQQYIVAIGLLNNKPYEIFAFKFNKNFNLDKGYIRKISRGRYDILNENKETYSEDITSEMSQVEENTTRLVSTSLRHGADIKFLVEQLSKARGNGFQDFSKVLARVLKKYIQDNEKVTGATCDNCGSSNLIYVGGCNECKDCGSSKCS